MSDLRTRIFTAIANAKPSEYADVVLAEIAKTHTLIPNQLVEDAHKARQHIGPGGRQAYESGVVARELARYWKRVRRS